MMKCVYLLEWYGPFISPRDVVDWEHKNIGNGKTYLYIFKGKKKGKRNYSIYCGKAFEQTAGKRLGNSNHHIKEVQDRKEHLSIWVAKFQNMNPNAYDVSIVEKLITSVLSQALVTDEEYVLNQTNMLRPKAQAYLINEWYYKNGEPVRQYREKSIPKLLPDLLICYPNDECSAIYGNKRIHYLTNLR